VLLPLYPNPTGSFQLNEVNRWLALHGVLEQRFNGHDHVELEVKCTQLTPEGRCATYATRPLVCALYTPGGEDCLRTVAKRRTPDDYQRIRDESDPVTLEVRA
jgi:Fe-S-cluster containining protein